MSDYAQIRPEPSTFRKVMNPESRAINGLLGSTGDDKFQSYLNPLFSYSQNEEVGTMERWSDPLFTTIDRNVGKRHFGYLNPVHTLCTDDTKENKIRSFIDPGVAAATSFIKNDTARDTASALLNPIGWAVGKLFGC